MNKEINTHINTLQNGIDNYDNINDAVKFVLYKDSEYLAENRVEIASLFYQILCSFSRLYKENANIAAAPETYKLFMHVSGLKTDPSIQSNDSNLMTIWFLNELYQKHYKGQGIDVEKTEFEEAIVHLLPGLNDIKYVFKIKDENNERYFPINRLILKVIEDDGFISGSKITPYHIRIFQLAVELFEEIAEKDALEKIKKKCNLEFLDYIDGNLKIIDTINHFNYQKNGVMIFYNEQKESLLIRHEKSEYFDDGNKKNPNTKVELNFQGDPIGYYLIVGANDFELISFQEAMEKDPIGLLKLIFEQEYYNIFFDKSLYLYNGTIHPINKYCYKDKHIVRDNENAYSHDKIKDVLSEYNSKSIKRQSVDMISLGLIVELLNKEIVGVDKLIEDFSKTDWMQNQVLEKWVMACTDSMEALQFVMTLWCNKLSYCRNKLEDYPVTNQPLLPLKCNLGWISNLLNLKNTSYVYQATVDIDESGKSCLIVNNLRTVDGKRKKIDTPIYISKDNFNSDVSEDDIENFKTLGTEHYIVYDAENSIWKCYIDKEYIFQLYSRVQLINEHALDYSLAQTIRINQLKSIENLMELHKRALLLDDMKTNKYIDFNYMVVYRLIHNMLWSKITAENWESYYKIISQHQKVDFASIKDDNLFHLDEEGTLFLPKEKLESDSTLYSIYTNYLKNHTCRDSKNLYSPKIAYDEKSDKYLINGKDIRKIVFLFDNICSGRSTICMLAAYFQRFDMVIPPLNEREIKLYEKKILCCNVADQIVPLNEILLKNKDVQIYVHSYYSTTRGRDKVLDFLKSCGYDNVCVDYKNELKRDSDLVFKDVEKIWPTQADKMRDAHPICLFIREFNQPKRNVFPDKMLENAYFAICLFVKKRELD